MLVEALHPIGDPAGAGLHEGDFEAWKTLEKPADDDAHNSDHLLERMGHGMGVKWMIETLGSRRHAVPGAYVNAQRHVEALRLGKERIEIGIIEVLFRGRNGWSSDGDKFEFFNCATQLLHGFDRILDRSRGDGFEAS